MEAAGARSGKAAGARSGKAAGARSGEASGVVRSALVLAVIGLSMLTIAARQPGPPPAPAGSSARPDQAATRRAGPGTPVATGLARSRPTGLEIPRIGVRTRLSELGLNADGTVQVPPLGTAAPAGWYRYLSSPGEIGPAVILGHVDSAADGPAVFYRLGELRPGDRVIVHRADGSTVRFSVSTVIAVPKQDFPTAAVYGPARRPVLRLVTCGGSFDAARHSYRDNVIVFAELA